MGQLSMPPSGAGNGPVPRVTSTWMGSGKHLKDQGSCALDAVSVVIYQLEYNSMNQSGVQTEAKSGMVS